MKNRTTAALLAFFVGGIGGHKFYLGQSGMGLLYLFFCWTFIPAFVAFIEAVMLVTMNDQTFNLKYNAGALLLAGAGASTQNTMAQNIVVNVPGAAGGGKQDVATQLSKLNELRVSGALTEEEYAAEKRRVLSTSS